MTSDQKEVYQKVFEFAHNAHDKHALKPENRFRKNGKGQNTEIPYIVHPIAVKDTALRIAGEQLFESDPSTERLLFIISLVALLHDVLEDTTVLEMELTLFLSTLLPESDVNTIVSAVNVLTKPKENFDILRYLRGIRSSYVTTIVKLADLEHNMSDLRPGNLLDKYRLCEHFLNQ